MSVWSRKITNNGRSQYRCDTPPKYYSVLGVVIVNQEILVIWGEEREE